MKKIIVYLACLFSIQVQATPQDKILYPDDRPFAQGPFVTTHNAFSSSAEGWLYAQQSASLDEQFKMGVRSFMMDIHWCSDDQGAPQLFLAHQPHRLENDQRLDYTDQKNQNGLSCWMSLAQTGGKPLKTFQSFLQNNLKKWMDLHPDAVISIHLQSVSGKTGGQVLQQLFKEAKLDSLIYENHGQEYPSFPTLGEMRDVNKRLVFFSDNPHDVSKFVFSTNSYRETQYNLFKYSAAERRFDRRTYANTTSLSVLNHFMPLSLESLQWITNDPSSTFFPTLSERLEIYECQEGILPTFIAIDHVTPKIVEDISRHYNRLTQRTILCHNSMVEKESISATLTLAKKLSQLGLLCISATKSLFSGSTALMLTLPYVTKQLLPWATLWSHKKRI